MLRWPVRKPPIDPHPPGINLLAPKPPDGIPDPIVYDGPLNVFIQLYGTLRAYIEAAHVKTDYDYIVPTPVTGAGEAGEAGIEAGKPVIKKDQPAPARPNVRRVSAGRPVSYDKGVVDPDIARRIAGNRRHRPPD
jgi:hypothetical protein